jgi:predicted TIM-barrel fold metal-dependent hydrolase
VRDTFGLTGRSEMEHGRIAFPPGRRDPLPPIRQEVNWDIKARIEDMDRASVDIGVLFPTHVSSYCALRDGGFENALYRAYHRWVADFCAQAPTRLKWTVVANMRDTAAGVAEIKYWADRDPNLVGVYVSPQAPGGRLLDNPDLHPLYDTAQGLDLPILAHGGTARPPYGPGTFDLDGAWFLLHAFSNPWAGMAALGALIGGGVFELFPKLRAAIIETGGGWLPLALDRLDTHYLMSPGHVPNLKRMPREVLAEGRYFHGIDSWERSLEFCVEELGEDLWLFATDWPHGDSAWPESVEQTVDRRRLTETARRKILGENAMRLCPRLRG